MHNHTHTGRCVRSYITYHSIYECTIKATASERTFWSARFMGVSPLLGGLYGQCSHVFCRIAVTIMITYV